MPLTTPKREARHRLLLQAALKIFARDGIDGASVADIADAAGVAKGSVYLYFDSKEALAGDLVHYLFSFQDTQPARLSEDSDPLGRIVRFCDAQEQRVQSLGNDSAIVLHMFGHVGKSRNDLLGRGIRQLMAESRFMVEVLMDNAKTKGLIPEGVDSFRAAVTILAATYGAIHQSLTMNAVGTAKCPKVCDVVTVILRGYGAKL